MASAQLSAEGMSVYSDSVLRLLGNSGRSDIKLVCHGKVFFSFKCFLSISSARFAEIFDTEKDIKTLEVVDMQPEVLELVLQYVYSATLDKMAMANAPAVYEAAVNYDMYPLKRLCASYIVRNVSEDTACDVLLLASRFPEDKKLMEAVRDFVANNRQFLESTTWKTFARRHKDVAEEFLESLGS